MKNEIRYLYTMIKTMTTILTIRKILHF